MVFKIGDAVKKKKFLLHVQAKFSKNFEMYRRKCIYFPSVYKKKIDGFLKNPAMKFCIP